MLPIVKSPDDSSTNTKRNIVLFIMESVAYDFFDSSNMYKVKMPFRKPLADTLRVRDSLAVFFQTKASILLP